MISYTATACLLLATLTHTLTALSLCSSGYHEHYGQSMDPHLHTAVGCHYGIEVQLEWEGAPAYTQIGVSYLRTLAWIMMLLLL